VKAPVSPKVLVVEQKCHTSTKDMVATNVMAQCYHMVSHSSSGTSLSNTFAEEMFTTCESTYVPRFCSCGAEPPYIVHHSRENILLISIYMDTTKGMVATNVVIELLLYGIKLLVISINTQAISFITHHYTIKSLSYLQ
jgi:hypothetical protein